MRAAWLFYSFLYFLPLDGQVLSRRIFAEDDGPGMGQAVQDSHTVYLNDVVYRRSLLLIHLPSSFDQTTRSSVFCSLAAQSGYHVISLAYPGLTNMYSSCEHSTDAACYENIHLELVDGINRASQIEIDSSESILYRLNRLLHFLNSNYPAEGWDRFLDEQGRIRFASTIWSGHSDGAGHALVIAKVHRVHRVICFSGPKDFSLHYYLPPVWFSNGSWKTDRSEIFAFAHTSDDYAFQREIWDSLGLSKFGAPMNVEASQPPYNSSHQLITSYPLPVANIHGSTILDDRTPRIAGNWVYEPVWKYVLDFASTPVKESNSVPFISIYPNPVQRGNPITLNTDITTGTARLYDLNGRLLRVFRDRIIYIDYALPAGPCFLHFTAGNQDLVFQLIIL